jgi:hypothetical protein
MFLFAIGDQIAALTRPTDLALLPVIDDGVLGRDVALDLQSDQNVAHRLILPGLDDSRAAVE